MLVERIVVDDAIVDVADSKLRCLVLSPCSTDVVSDFSSLHLSDSSSTISPTSTKSASTSPSSSDPIASKDPDRFLIVNSLIQDLLASVCQQDNDIYAPCSVEVNEYYSLPEFSFSDEEGEMGEDPVRTYSPLLDDETPFRASSLLNIFYGVEEPTSSEEHALCENDLKALEHLFDESNTSSEEQESKSDLDYHTIEFHGDVANSYISGLDELPDVSLDWLELDRHCSADKSKTGISKTSQQMENLIHFYEPKDFTPADLLPLYEPDIPLEFPYPKRESSLATAWCIEDISDLEHRDLQVPELERRVQESQIRLSDDENFFADLTLGTEEFVLSLSDEENRAINDLCCGFEADRSQLESNISPTSFVEIDRFSYTAYDSVSSRSIPLSSIRNRQRRRRSFDPSDGNQSFSKRSRTVTSHDDHVQLCSSMHLHKVNSDDDSIGFRGDRLWNELRRSSGFVFRDNAHRKQSVSSFGVKRGYSAKAYSLLTTFLQLCVFFIEVLRCIPNNASKYVCSQFFQLSKTILARLFSLFAIFASYLWIQVGCRYRGG